MLLTGAADCLGASMMVVALKVPANPISAIETGADVGATTTLASASIVAEPKPLSPPPASSLISTAFLKVESSTLLRKLNQKTMKDRSNSALFERWLNGNY